MKKKLFVIYKATPLMEEYFPKVLDFIPSGTEIEKIVLPPEAKKTEIKEEIMRLLQKVSGPSLYLSDFACGRYGNFITSPGIFLEAEKKGLKILENMETAIAKLARRSLAKGYPKSMELFNTSIKAFMIEPSSIAIFRANIADHSYDLTSGLGTPFGGEEIFIGELKASLAKCFPDIPITIIKSKEQAIDAVNKKNQLIISDSNCKFFHFDKDWLEPRPRHSSKIFFLPIDTPIYNMLRDGVKAVDFNPRDIYEEIFVPKKIKKIKMP